VGYYGTENFPQALISKSLQIICKIFWEIYTPLGYRGGWGYPLRDQPSAISYQQRPVPLDLVHALIVRRRKVIICKRGAHFDAELLKLLPVFRSTRGFDYRWSRKGCCCYLSLICSQFALHPAIDRASACSFYGSFSCGEGSRFRRRLGPGIKRSISWMR
jgi:hypothetical protein